ncbi:MAG: DUF885 family protein [Gammaproteobacteria bacterium]
MRTAFRWLVNLLGLSLVVAIVLAVNVIWFRPFSINAFYDKVFIQFALDNPQLLSGMRLLENIGLRGHNAELNDVSPAKNEADVEFLQQALNTLNAYDRDKLDGQDALSFDILDFFLRRQAEGIDFLWHDYPVNQISGAQGDFPDFMATTHHLGDAKDCEHYRARLAKADVFFAQVIEQLEVRAARDLVAPRFALAGAKRDIDKFLEGAAQDNILYTNYLERAEKMPQKDRDACVEQKDEVARLIDEVVRPSYDSLSSYVALLLETATTDHGVWKLPNGAAYYAYKLREHTTTDISADEVHALGVAEVARISAEMDAVLVSEGYIEGTVGERMIVLASEPRFNYPNTDEGREAALEEYRSIIREIEAGMADMFDLSIEAPVEVRRIPKFREAGAPGAYYQGPAQDGSRPGVFYANMRDMKELPRFGMRTLSYHEAIPGHHYQTALQTELQGVPMFRRMLGFTAFSEGWALYAERLAFESGFQSDPFDNLGRLQDEMLRAVRLVVDSGMHHKRWTREEAIDYMVRYTGQDRASVTTEIERYLVWPGQATAYKIGMLKILELRERAKVALGDDFDIRAFHRVVLGNGDVPLFLLEEQVDAYIRNNGGA